MTAEDDAYVREHFVAATPEAMALMLDDRLPLPSYVLGDGTPMVPAAHGELAEVAGGVDRLHDWFVAFWEDDPATGEQEWAALPVRAVRLPARGEPIRIKQKTERVAEADRRGRPAAPRPARPDRARDARRGGRRRARPCPGSTRCCCR